MEPRSRSSIDTRESINPTRQLAVPAVSARATSCRVRPGAAPVSRRRALFPACLHATFFCPSLFTCRSICLTLVCSHARSSPDLLSATPPPSLRLASAPSRPRSSHARFAISPPPSLLFFFSSLSLLDSLSFVNPGMRGSSFKTRSRLFCPPSPFFRLANSLPRSLPSSLSLPLSLSSLIESMN